jgi:predicted RNA binding protein YcfA (HicA-like mRNA interferase family)
MPPKIRELKAELRRAGFIEFSRRGKGSHAKWEHPSHPDIFVILAGQDGDDGKVYLVRAVREAIARANERAGQE